jgi:hypothetical protein
MDTTLEQFCKRLGEQWLPDFCNDPKRQLPTDGFAHASIRVSTTDASNFMRALDSNVVHDHGGGRYRCARSSVAEQIIWEGRRDTNPRKLTLWLEPIITIATMARLHLDYGWPTACLGMQSRQWAFDFEVFLHPDAAEATIAGEVKKHQRELDRMIELMMQFADLGVSAEPIKAAERNAFRKWRALRDGKIPYFCAVADDGHTRLFSVEYHGERHGAFHALALANLHASSHQPSLGTSHPLPPAPITS